MQPVPRHAMTSDGRAYSRFRSALERGSPLQVRAAASDLATLGLDDALAVCLVFLDREPEVFPRAAARWVARLVLERPVALVDAQLALASLGALQHGDRRAGGEALIELCTTCRVPRVEAILTSWLDRQGLAN